MKIKMLTSVVFSKLIFSHGQVFDTDINIDEKLAKDFIKLKRAKVIEEKTVTKSTKKKRSSKKVKSDES